MNILTTIKQAAASLTQFARPSASGEVTDGSNPGAAVALYDEEATSLMIKMLTKMPELDEVLKQAGVRRERLRVLLYDDEIAQACETRLDALLATPMRLEPSEGAAADTLVDILKPVLIDAVAGIFNARLFGYSVLEAVYYIREDKRVGLRFLGEKPMEWFEPRADGELRLYPDDGSAGAYGLVVDQRYKFFCTRSRPTYRNPYGEALLSRLYWPWYFRTNGWKFWAKFLERFGSPLLVGKSSDPKTMVSALLQAHSQAVMGVGSDDTVESVGVPTGNSGQAFDMFETALIRRIQKVVLGQTLTSGTDGGSGNRALGAVHELVRMDKRNSDLTMVTQTMQRIVDALCEVNNFPKHMVMFADDVGLGQDRATRDKTLHEIGVRFEPEYFTDNYGLRDDDFTMSSEAVATGLPPGQPPQGGAANPGQTGDAKATPNAGTATKAAQGRHRLFSQVAKPTKFTPQQEVVEDVGATALAAAGLPLDMSMVRSAVLAATDPDDLADRLFALVGDKVSAPDFTQILEAALFAADVLGYVHAEGKV